MRLVTLIGVALFAITSSLGIANAQGVITVPPSGGDDTATIQAAFDNAVAAGPGSTVQLQAGTYCVYAPIIVRGFDGQWIGVGRDETTVRTCTKPAPFPVPAFIVPDPAFPGDPSLEIRSPFVFIEVDGKPSTDVRISDMTIHLEGETNPWFIPQRPGEPLTLFRPAIQVFGSRPTVFDGVVSSASVAIDGIELRGNADGLAFGDPSESNIDNGIIVQGKSPFGQIQANVSVTRSHFERVAFSALQIDECATSCDIVVGGSANAANTFSRHFGTVLFAFLNNQSLVEVSHNRGDTQQGAATVIQLPIPPSDLSDVVISHNRLNLFSGPINPSNGLILQDLSLAFSNTQGFRALIEHNIFGQTDLGFGSSPDLGIGHIIGKGTIIRGNTISGDFAIAGIAAGFAGPLAVGQNLAIMGNNLSGTTAGVAPIWLGPFSSDSVVVGGPNSNHVLDQGVGNVVTGVNNMNGNPPGPELQEAIEQMLEFREFQIGP
jgi:hypothetical protein